MPLFMDMHSIDGGVQASDVAAAHQADLATQAGCDMIMAPGGTKILVRGITLPGCLGRGLWKMAGAGGVPVGLHSC